MEKVSDYTKAGLKVCYDKLCEYTSYYVYGHPENYKPGDNIMSDTMTDYDSIIDTKRYNDESKNKTKRVYDTVGFFQKYSTFFNKPTHIVDNIYLGSAFNAASHRTLKKLNIKVIINISNELSKYYCDYPKNEFIYHQHTVYDDNRCSIDEVLKQAYEAIMKYDKKTNILIHCFMGASRSVSVVAYYLMQHKKFTLDAALKFIREKRPSINPTFRFTKDLAASQMMPNRNEPKVKEKTKINEEENKVKEKTKINETGVH